MNIAMAIQEMEKPFFLLFIWQNLTKSTTYYIKCKKLLDDKTLLVVNHVQSKILKSQPAYLTGSKK